MSFPVIETRRLLLREIAPGDAADLFAIHGDPVLMRWFDPTGWLTLVQQEGVQTGGVVPTMLRLITDQPMEDYDLSSLRRLTSGSAPSRSASAISRVGLPDSSVSDTS